MFSTPPGLTTRTEIAALVSSVDRPVKFCGDTGAPLNVADLTANRRPANQPWQCLARAAFGSLLRAAQENARTRNLCVRRRSSQQPRSALCSSLLGERIANSYECCHRRRYRLHEQIDRLSFAKHLFTEAGGRLGER